MRETPKTVLITGAAKGMGLAVAELLLRQGWRVDLLDRDAEALDTVARRFPDAALPIVCDVRDDGGCREAVERIVAWGGSLDAAINCAGVWVYGPIETMGVDDWDRVLDINLKGTFLVCKHSVPHIRRSEGVIINVSSDAGKQGSTGASVYCASKAGVLRMTEVIALELAPHGARAVTVCPGEVDSPMQDAMLAEAPDLEAAKAAVLSTLPQGARARFITVEEIVNLVGFLVSDAAAPITGTAISIDFGTTAGRHEMEGYNSISAGDW